MCPIMSQMYKKTQKLPPPVLIFVNTSRGYIFLRNFQ